MTRSLPVRAILVLSSCLIASAQPQRTSHVEIVQPNQPARVETGPPLRIQVDVFEVKLSDEDAASLSADALHGVAGSAQELSSKLGQMGSARALYRLDLPFSMDGYLKASSAIKAPIPRDTQTDDGKTRTSVTYQDSGATIEIDRARYLPDEEKWAITLSIKSSTVSETAIELSQGGYAPAFRNISSNSTLIIGSGDTRVLTFIDHTPRTDKQPMAQVVRIAMLPL